MSSSEFNWNGAFSDYNSQGMNRSRGLDSTVNNRQQPVGPWLLQSQADDYGIMHMVSNPIRAFICLIYTY